MPTISATDQGSTWSRHYGAVKVMSEGHNFDETMVVELQGNLLWMLARTKRGALAQSYSRTAVQTGFGRRLDSAS